MFSLYSWACCIELLGTDESPSLNSTNKKQHPPPEPLAFPATRTSEQALRRQLLSSTECRRRQLMSFKKKSKPVDETAAAVDLLIEHHQRHAAHVPKIKGPRRMNVARFDPAAPPRPEWRCQPQPRQTESEERALDNHGLISSDMSDGGGGSSFRCPVAPVFQKNSTALPAFCYSRLRRRRRRGKQHLVSCETHSFRTNTSADGPHRLSA
jgi:hypothetical protein